MSQIQPVRRELRDLGQRETQRLAQVHRAVQLARDLVEHRSSWFRRRRSFFPPLSEDIASALPPWNESISVGEARHGVRRRRVKPALRAPARAASVESNARFKLLRRMA